MGEETLLELRVGGLFRHDRKRFHELLLGVVDVLQLMHEQVVHGFDVFAKQSHLCGPPGVMEHAVWLPLARARHLFDC
jgi:hypothetical protein